MPRCYRRRRPEVKPGSGSWRGAFGRMHWNLILVPVVFLLTVFGPGFLCVRRLDWSIEEKIAASLTLSLLFLGLACFGVFASGLPRAAHGVILAACAVLTLSLSTG